MLQGRDGDPRLRQAAKDLARAQEHIEFLQSTLRDHNHAVIEGREQSRHAVGQYQSNMILSGGWRWQCWFLVAYF